MQATRPTTVLASSPVRRLLLLFCASVSLLLASACGGGDDDPGSVTLQLDWTPNTNHVGIYVALANGWYEDEGIEVNILPYSDLNPDTVVANGQADIGVSFPANVVFSRAAGLDLVSVAAVLQSNVTEIAVLASSDIERPRDLDGKTYAGFGLPYEAPRLKAVIQFDGGTGEFDTATLNTAAYEALYNGRADFTEIFTTWEGIEAELRGIELRTFRYDDYGLPDFPGVVLVASQDAVKERSGTLRSFLEVTQRGYEYAAEHPEEAAQIFIDYVGEDVFPEPEMVRLSNIALAPVFVNEDGRWGVQRSGDWNAYSHWLLEQDIVTDQDGHPLHDLEGDPLFTNELLPGE